MRLRNVQQNKSQAHGILGQLSVISTEKTVKAMRQMEQVRERIQGKKRLELWGTSALRPGEKAGGGGRGGEETKKGR